MVEPVLGEGGFVVPPLGFFRRWRRYAGIAGLFLSLMKCKPGLAVPGNYLPVLISVSSPI